MCGLFLGTIAYGRFGQKVGKRKAINLSFIASGIFIIVFTLLIDYKASFFAAGTLAGLLGIAISPVVASTNTLTHETIPEAVRGRVFSSLEAVIHFAFLIFMFVAAYAAKYVDRFWILVITGTMFAICGILGIISARRRAT